MNIFRNLMDLFGKKKTPGKIKIRGKKGQRKTIKGGRFARKLHRKWARAHKAYTPGQLGSSAVSDLNRKDYGVIMSRRERKQSARRTGRAMRKYYNGPTSFRRSSIR